MIESFKVAAVSTNTNSFGLYGHIFIARSGKAFEAAANHINRKNKGEVVRLDADNPNFAELGFEIPRELPTAPEEVVNEVWA